MRVTLICVDSLPVVLSQHMSAYCTAGEHFKTEGSPSQALDRLIDLQVRSYIDVTFPFLSFIFIFICFFVDIIVSFTVMMSCVTE